MASPVTRSSTPRLAWWLGWFVVTVLIGGGVYLALRDAGETPAAVDTRR